MTLHYTLRLAPGERVAEATAGGPPATVVIGSDDMIPGLQQRLLGLRAGERRRFEVPCLEAFGPAEAGNAHALPRAEFPAELALAPGLVIGFATPTGEELPGVVQAVTGDTVIVDFSHPLAGHDLIFDVEILEVEQAE